MNKKKILSFLLAAVMTVALAASGFTASAEPVKATDIDVQLNLIASSLGSMKQADGVSVWYYAVTDLDHDGNLEFVAASQHPYDRSTNLKVWEVSTDRTALAECTLNKDADESFPDILTEAADTFYDAASDSWFYLFYDNVVISNYEVYTVKTSVCLKNGLISYTPYGVEHTVVQANNVKSVTHTDANGFPVSAEQYSASAFNAFTGAARSSTGFEWLTGSELDDLSRLTDSIAVFNGDKAPTQRIPFPIPQALQNTAVTPVPTATPAQPVRQNQNIFLTITKNPTNENKKSGGTANFVACANTYESLNWTFVSPDGGSYSPASFISGSNASIGGEYSTTLSVYNVESWMNGWAVYCTFYYQGQVASTSYAYLYVDGSQPQTPDWNVTYSSMSGTCYSDTAFTVYVVLQNGQSMHLNGSLVNIVSGDDIDGAPCTVYYINALTESSVYGIDVYGYSSAPDPGTPDPGIPDTIQRSIDGTCYSDTAFTVYVVLNNGQDMHLDGNLVNIISGDNIDGAPCTVYYNDPLSESTVFAIDVYGFDSSPDYDQDTDDDSQWPVYDEDTNYLSGDLPGDDFDEDTNYLSGDLPGYDG